MADLATSGPWPLIGLWQGPTVDQLDALRTAGLPVIADQNDVGLARLDDPILVGWLQQDEPDNAQSDGAGGYGPCIEPAEIIARYERMRVALGVDRLREWTRGEKPVWTVIETTHISADVMPTPDQVRAEVWMSLIHGVTGIFYFAHEWQPRIREAGLLYSPETRDAVATLNRQIVDLAPVLNSPSMPDGVRVTSSNPDVPVDVVVKRHDGWMYVLAVAMRDGATEATFTLPVGHLGGLVEVIGESRAISSAGATFRDAFTGYAVHLYRVRTEWWLALPWLTP